MEPRYIERLLHGKRWDKNRDRTLLLVLEKTRYIETRYRELRLYKLLFIIFFQDPVFTIEKVF